MEQELGGSLHIVPPGAATIQPLEADTVYLAIAEVREGQVRRRVFLSLAPAERIVQNARARGVSAHLYVLEARPSVEVTVASVSAAEVSR